MARTRDDRRRQVITTRQKYGPTWYSEIGSKSATFKDPEKARLAAMKRWHPELFDENGQLKQEVDNVNNRQE